MGIFCRSVGAIQKPLVFIGSSHKDLLEFPEDVVRVIGFAMELAQAGETHPHAKPLRGFGGAGVVEVVEDFDRNAYRAVYTVKFEGVIYCLHAFQKKSRRGIETPREEIETVRRRLKLAEEIHVERKKEDRE